VQFQDRANLAEAIRRIEAERGSPGAAYAQLDLIASEPVLQGRLGRALQLQIDRGAHCVGIACKPDETANGLRLTRELIHEVEAQVTRGRS